VYCTARDIGAAIPSDTAGVAFRDNGGSKSSFRARVIRDGWRKIEFRLRAESLEDAKREAGMWQVLEDRCHVISDATSFDAKSRRATEERILAEKWTEDARKAKRCCYVCGYLFKKGVTRKYGMCRVCMEATMNERKFRCRYCGENGDAYDVAVFHGNISKDKGHILNGWTCADFGRPCVL